MKHKKAERTSLYTAEKGGVTAASKTSEVFLLDWI